LAKRKYTDSNSDTVEEIMKDLATQIEINNKTMRVLFEESKEMILELMAMVKKIHEIAVTQQEQILKLKTEITRLKAKAPRKTIRLKLQSSRRILI